LFPEAVPANHTEIRLNHSVPCIWKPRWFHRMLLFLSEENMKVSTHSVGIHSSNIERKSKKLTRNITSKLYTVEMQPDSNSFFK
jgi:hypothetical protein